MAERNLSIRLSVVDGGKVKAELSEIGEKGERSLKKSRRRQHRHPVASSSYPAQPMTPSFNWKPQPIGSASSARSWASSVPPA